jgi:hypothetical protein
LSSCGKRPPGSCPRSRTGHWRTSKHQKVVDAVAVGIAGGPGVRVRLSHRGLPQAELFGSYR